MSLFDTRRARENWRTKYKYDDETPLETFQRVARGLAEIEKEEYGASESETEGYYEEYLKTLVNLEQDDDADSSEEDVVELRDGTYRAKGLYCTPGGRITANIGTEFDEATTWNCFINAPVSDSEISYEVELPSEGHENIEVDVEGEQTPDNLTNIFLSLLEAGETLKSEGGYGINFGFIRPRGTLIEGIGIRHPGVVSYMELWDRMSDVIVRGDNDGYEDTLTNFLDEETEDRLEKTMPRKGAMLAALPVWHPDIEEFVRAKSEDKERSGKLSKFNISVLVDDDFMKAVENDNMYDLTFNGETHKRIRAQELYDLIMESTYNSNDPGVLFFDNMNRNNPLLYLGPNSATNPCLAEGTRVATEDGLRPVEDIEEGDNIQTSLGFDPVEEIEKHEDHPVYRVEFSDGTVLRATEDHIFHVMQGSHCRKTWDNETRLKDLEEGDYVRKQPYRFNSNGRSDLTRNDGFLAGYWLGDGCRNEMNRFNLSANQSEDNSYLREALEEKGFTYHEDHSAEGNAMHFRVQSKEDVMAFVERTGIDLESYSHEKQMPEWWINASEDFLAGVMDGLFCADGNVNLSGRYASLRLKTCSEELADDIREVGLRIGSDVKKYHAHEAGEVQEIYGREVERNHDVYELHLTNDCIESFYHFVGFLSHPEKNEDLETILREKQLTGTRWKVKIESIERDGTADVYDLYEPKADDWNTHGIVSRGCGEIGGSTFVDGTYDCDDYLEPYMENYGKDDHFLGFTTVCLLGSVNLTQFVREDRTFDWEAYREKVRSFARMLDNVNDIDRAPLQSYQWAIENIRQYGMGVNGLGSALYMLEMAYGSEEAVEFTEKVNLIKDEETMDVSAELAKERGPFPMYSEEYLETPYFQDHCHASEDVKDKVREHGLRNAKRLTNPPLGNSSVICDNVSNGIEPVFDHGYERTIIADDWPEGLNRDNVKEKLEEIEIGGATAWRGEYEGTTYYYEPFNRGLCIVDQISDYGYQWVREHYPEDVEANRDYLVTTQDLDISDHVTMQSSVQKHVDQSVSKTSNLPEDYPFEDFKELYRQAWESGLVGFTTFREGTMENVLSSDSEEQEEDAEEAESLLDLYEEHGCLSENAELTDENIVVKDVDLPDTFENGPTEIIRADGNKYYCHLSYLKKRRQFPIALWVHSNSLKDKEYVSLNRAVKEIIKLLQEKGVDYDLVFEQQEKTSDDPHHVRLGKMVSMALRHNVSMTSIIGAISDVEGGYVASTLHAVRKFLKKSLEDGTEAPYECDQCGSDEMVFESGCETCRDCGYSACG